MEGNRQAGRLPDRCRDMAEKITEWLSEGKWKVKGNVSLERYNGRKAKKIAEIDIGVLSSTI